MRATTPRTTTPGPENKAIHRLSTTVLVYKQNKVHKHAPALRPVARFTAARFECKFDTIYCFSGRGEALRRRFLT